MKRLLIMVILLIQSISYANVDNDKVADLVKTAKQGDPQSQFELSILLFEEIKDISTKKDSDKAVGDYALYLITTASESGLTEAQVMLAEMYYFGEYIPQNKAKAGYWYQKAAASGHVYAQYALGLAYLKGDLPDGKDIDTAIRWYRRAALQGHVKAQYDLGLMYSQGKIIPINYQDSAFFIKKAAMQGHPEAAGILGALFYNGNGVPKSLTSSYAWLNIAAAKGVGDSQRLLLKMEDLMTQDQIQNAQDLSIEIQRIIDKSRKSRVNRN